MAKLLKARLSHREFFKWCGVAVAGAATAQLVSPPKVAFADYPINDNLIVSGFIRTAVGGASNTGSLQFGLADVVMDWADSSTWRIKAWNGSGYADAIAIRRTSGNIGIGTVGPGSLLDVNGTANLRGIPGGVGVSVDPSGRVGIGHPSPAYRFHIWDGGTNGYTGLAISPGASPVDPLDLQVLKDTNFRLSMVNQDSGRGYQGIDLRVATWGQPNGYVKLLGNMFQYAETGYLDQIGAAGTPRLTILSGGNVGIGTTSPETTLHLGSGGFKIGARLIADTNGAYYAP